MKERHRSKDKAESEETVNRKVDGEKGRVMRDANGKHRMMKEGRQV